MGIASYSTLPNDEIMPLPWVGWVGFRGAAAVTLPVSWIWEHRTAEAGGYFREGRRWQQPDVDLSPVPTPCIPVVQLYAPMIERISLAAAADIGYTVDQ